jgi:hypothetical protein
MFVLTRCDGENLAVHLSQLEGVAMEDATCQAIEGWHCWVGRGDEY